MSANPMNTINVGQTTEACPQMRRRFRAGVAADLSVWLLMIRDQYAAQLTALPLPIDASLTRSYQGTKAYLSSMVKIVGTLAGRVADKWSVHEWNAAAQTFGEVIDAATGRVDDDAARAAQSLDTRDQGGN